MKHHTPSPNPKQSGTFVTATETLPARHHPKHWQKCLLWVRDRVSPQAFVTYLVTLEMNGMFSPPPLEKKAIANKRRVHPKTVYNHAIELEAANVWRIERTKKSRRRNAPNRYIPLDIDGRPLHLKQETICTEKIKTELSTTTKSPTACAGGGNLLEMPKPPSEPPSEPAPARQPRPAFSRSAENHPPQMRRRWNERQTYLRDGQRWNELREEKAQQRCRRATEARLGIYKPEDATMKPATEATEATEAEMQVWREQQRKRREQLAAQEERERIEWAEAAKRKRESMAEPPTPEELERIERLNRKLALARSGVKSEDVQQRWAEAEARNQEAFSDERRNDDTTAARRNHTKNQSGAKQPLTPLSGDC